MAKEQKTWFLDWIGVSYDFACLEEMHPSFRDNYSHRMCRFLKWGDPVISCISMEIAALKLRRPYSFISIKLKPYPAATPAIQKCLIGTELQVPLQYDITGLHEIPETDEALSEFFVKCIADGLDAMAPESDILRPAYSAGVAALRSNNYVTQQYRPHRTRVVGAELLIEVSYDFSATERICHMRFWRPGKPKVDYTHSFTTKRTLGDRQIERNGNPDVQGAVRDRDFIRPAQTSWSDGPYNGMRAMADMADYAIPLAKIENAIGPVTRLSKNMRLRVLNPRTQS